MPKPLLSVSDSSPSGLGPPLYMNGGLIGSMDSIVALQNLRGGIPGIPISGIMAAGFSHGFPAAVSAGGSGAEDVKNGLSMLPMMLHGIPHGASIPQHALFSVGAMMAHAAPPPPHPGSASASPSSSTSPPASAANVTTTTAPSEAASPSSTTPADREGASSSLGEKGPAGGAKRPAGVESAVVASASRAHLSSAHLGTAAGSHHAFNPFLIPGVSHGLLYPHMFLPHGSIVALPAVPPGDASPGSPKRRRKRAREDEEKVAAGDAEEAPHLAASSSSSTSALEPPPAEETGLGGATNGPSEPQKPDSHSEGAATEDGHEEAGGEAEQ